MPTPVSFDPSTYNTSTQGVFTLGARYDYLGRIFRYIQAANGAADANLANGDVCEWAATAQGGSTPGTYLVNNVRAGGSSLGRSCAGVAVGTITKNYYGFILTAGKHTAVKNTGGSTTVGKSQTIRTATNGEGADAANLYDPEFGTCLLTAAAGVYTVEVNC